MKKCMILIVLFLSASFLASGVAQTAPQGTPGQDSSKNVVTTNKPADPNGTAGATTNSQANEGSNAGTPGGQKKDDSANPAPWWGFWVTYTAMGTLLIILSLAILRGLKGWSLSEALSEDGKASISRLLALLGFSVIISIYLGTGCGVIFRILGGGAVTDLGSLGTFLAGGAALFTPYIANQIKGAVNGVVNGPSSPGTTAASMVTAFSPKGIQSGNPQKISVTGANLLPIQGATYTSENGAESQLPTANVNVLNGGAVELTMTMASPQTPGTPYPSTLVLLTKDGQRIPVGSFMVS